MNEIDHLNALKENISHSKKIIGELNTVITSNDKMDDLERAGYAADIKERKLLESTFDSLISQLSIINNSIPVLLREISIFKEIPKTRKDVNVKKRKETLTSVKYKAPIEKKGSMITVSSSEKSKFLNKLSVSDESIKKIIKRRGKFKVKEESVSFRKPSQYARLSNKLFSNLSTSLVDKGYFAGINRELRRANLPYLSHTYISMAFLTTLISVFAAFLLFLVFLFFNLSINFPFFVLAGDSILIRFLRYFWIIFAIPIITFMAFYFFPSTEKKSIENKINQELPFVVIHMSAIAGSGIEPTKIFKIMIKGEEYPAIKQEIRKLLNEINIYGFDLVSALRNSARITSSPKLAELFNGFATTITSGGDLKDFLEKRSEGLVFDYRLEREKYTKIAETFMDIYISVVIAAPMMMTMMLVLISLIGADFSIGLEALSILMVSAVGVINVIFLVFLHLRQPEG